MNQPCKMVGCCMPSTSRYAALCARHRATLHRHGHPEQAALKVTELAPYRRMVAARRKANPTSTAWTTLEGHWRGIVDRAEEVLRIRNSGVAHNGFEAEAARHVLAVATAVPAAQVVETILAIGILSVREPQRFRSLKAFDHQLVRRFRGLAETSFGAHWNHKTQRVHKVYRDLSPRTVQQLAHWLKGFLPAWVQLAALEQAQAQEEQRKQLREALAALR